MKVAVTYSIKSSTLFIFFSYASYVFLWTDIILIKKYKTNKKSLVLQDPDWRKVYTLSRT
jgi:hypothetical protein